MERMSKCTITNQKLVVDQLPKVIKPDSHHRPINLLLYINGDQYFPGKKIHFIPNRYSNFNEFLNDLTGRLAPDVKLPHGVRQIFTPIGGRRIFDLNDLSEGEMYVCAGFEGFKMMKYGRSQMQPWSVGHNWRNTTMKLEKAPESHGSYLYRGYANNAFHPSRYFHTSQSTQLRRWPGMFGANQRGDHNLSKSNNIQQKPRVITVIRNGSRPRPNVKILLNHQVMQSYEQLLADISGAFVPQWKNNNVHRLFTVRGKEIFGISDFFRGDDIFIAQGTGEPNLKKNEIAGILEELFPDSNIVKLLLRDWRKNQRHLNKSYHTGRDRTSKPDSNILMADHTGTAIDCSVQEKRDSGFDSGDSNMNWPESELTESIHILRPRKRLGRKMHRKSKQKERKAGTDYDVASSVPQNVYAHRQIDLDRQIEKLRDEDFNKDKENLRSQKENTDAIALKKIDNDGKKKSLISLNKKSVNFKQIDELVLTKDRKLLKVTEIIKEQQKLEMEKLHKEKEDRENAEKAARERMAQAEKEKHEEEASEKEILKKSERETHTAECDLQGNGTEMLKKSERETHTVECDLQGNGTEMEHLKAQDGSVLDSPNVPETKDNQCASDVSANFGTPINKEGLSLNGSAPKVKVQSVESRTATLGNVNAQKDSQQSKEIRKQDPEDTQEKKRRKSKVVHKTKKERQVSSDDVVTAQYELGRKLGDGNFANVYQSRKTGSGREFAVKVIDKSKVRGKEYMVENEISIMKDCRQHNIVRLYEEFETPNWIYLVMELVKGGDLFDVITQNIKFTEVESALLVKDLCHALFYLHSRRIVHRDIKPENLLVQRNKDGSMTLKLADFGLAMEVKELIYTVCGTPTYVAPEILNETGYGLEVDMWAVGVITYILLCGFPPFRSPDRNQSELFKSIKTGQFEFLSPFWDLVSRNAKDLISHLLVVDKRKRYTATDVLTHTWIVCNGRTNVVPEFSMFADGVDLHLRQDLEEKARLNYQVYQRLTDKKKRQRD